MGKFEGISRQLEHAFAELESAQGAAKRRWLRIARLLLLLADEMITDADAEAAAPSHGGGPFGADPVFSDDVAGARTLLSYAEDAVRSAERGPCRGLQTVLVLRKSPNRLKNPEAAAKSHAPRAQS